MRAGGWASPHLVTRAPLPLTLARAAGGRLLMRIADKEVEYNSNFRFYITTKLSNPHYSPETSAKTTIVNFAVKEQVGAGAAAWTQLARSRKHPESRVEAAGGVETKAPCAGRQGTRWGEA